MKFNAYRLTGDPEADTKALRAWGLSVTVTNENGELSIEIDRPGYWVTGCLGYRFIARAGNLVVFSPDERNPMHIKIADEVTADDAPEKRTKRWTTQN
nr:MAG TPA: hypothetical protein [Caudoviricetes sp.]